MKQLYSWSTKQYSVVILWKGKQMRWKLSLWLCAGRYFPNSHTERGTYTEDGGIGEFETDQIWGKQRQQEIVGQNTEEEGVYRERLQAAEVPTWVYCWSISSTCVGWKSVRLGSYKPCSSQSSHRAGRRLSSNWTLWKDLNSQALGEDPRKLCLSNRDKPALEGRLLENLPNKAKQQVSKRSAWPRTSWTASQSTPKFLKGRLKSSYSAAQFNNIQHPIKNYRTFQEAGK